MGTRSSAKIKLRTGPYRCDVCGRRLMSAEALRTHQICYHNITSKVKTKVAPTKQGVTKSKTQPQTQRKNIKPDNNGVKSKNVPSKKMKINTKPSNKMIEKDMGKRAAKPVETCNEYECPKCLKSFPIYFLALRHIQMNHCVDKNNVKVSPNSPDLIKPNVVLVCVKCNKRPKSVETHKCKSYKFDTGDTVPSPPFYICMACDQQFQSLRLFDIHVSGLHCDGVESMFFPTNEVFQTWKEDVISQTGVKYNTLGNYNYKQMLRCPCVPESENTVEDISPFLCPSCIVVQELPKGIQVHIYKKHYAHKCGAYVLPEVYEKYTLSTLIQNDEAYTQVEQNSKINESDIYLQFKQLMECIVQDAAKVNVDSLKILISKALDMTSVLNNTEDDKDCASVKKVLENNITGILGQLDDEGAKKRRASNEKSKVEPITKRFKTRKCQNKDGSKNTLQDSSIKIVNSFSLAEKDITDAINEFSDSDDTEDKTCRQTPEKDSSDQSSSDKERDDAQNKKVRNKDEQSPTSFAESYKDFVKQITVPLDTKKKKMKPNWSKKSRNLSPKSHNDAKEMKRLKPSIIETLPPEESMKISNIPRIVDLKYEVKEQENDCNILILKI